MRRTTRRSALCEALALASRGATRREEGEWEHATTLLAYMCRLGEASQVVATGTWDGESLDDAVQLAASGCARVDAALREALRSSVSA